MKIDPITELWTEAEEMLPLVPAMPAQDIGFPELFGKDTLHMKVEDTKHEYKVSLKTPGYEKEHLRVNVKNGILTFSGERSEEKKTKDSYSNSYDSFTRSIPLPAGVHPKGAKVEVRNGEVKITMEKKNGK